MVGPHRAAEPAASRLSRRHPARRAALAAAVLCAAACTGGGSRAVAEFDMVDLSAPAMFANLMSGLRRAHVVELPPRAINARFDLHLNDTTEREVLEAIVKLDPTFQFRDTGDVAMLFPRGKEEETSPFSRRVASFSAQGGAATVVRQLIEQAGLGGQTVLQSEQAGSRRPVALDVHGVSVRDALASVAAQAHLSIYVEPGKVQLVAAAE